MVLPAAPLAGRGCLVTGAGRGLGAALALDLLDQGATVVALSRQQHELETLASLALERGLRPNLLLAPGSTLDPQCTSSAIAQLRGQGCELNLLVANASVFGPRECLLAGGLGKCCHHQCVGSQPLLPCCNPCHATGTGCPDSGDWFCHWSSAIQPCQCLRRVQSDGLVVGEVSQSGAGPCTDCRQRMDPRAVAHQHESRCSKPSRVPATG